MNEAVAVSRELTERLAFFRPVAPADRVYRPAVYAREILENYLGRYGAGRKRVVFLGMNPGPDGMGQTGVPFGDVVAVRDWMGLTGEVYPPSDLHPKRPVVGLRAAKREPSGARLWGLFKKKFGTPESFFREHIVWNYCPLLFFQNTAQGKNITPEQLPSASLRPVEAACDEALAALLRVWDPRFVVGVGRYAERCARRVAEGTSVSVVGLAHPSPANPGTNGDWAGAAEASLVSDGVWG